MKWAKRAVEVYPQELGAHLEYLEILLRVGELDTAWEHLDQSELPAGVKGEWYLRLANSADAAGEFALALKAAEETLQIDGGNSAALAIKRRSLAKLGRTGEAEALFRPRQRAWKSKTRGAAWTWRRVPWTKPKIISAAF